MPSDRAPKTDLRRLIVLALCLTFGFSVIVAQLVRYQVTQHEKLREEAIAQRQEEKEITPPRADIFDRNGHYLAMDTVEWDISVSPPLVMDPDELADQLAELLEQPREDIYGLLTADVQWTRIARQVPQEVGEAIIHLEASGLECIPQPKRVYPNGSLFSHVIGIVTLVGDGFRGVEGYYNQPLKGILGRIVIELDPFGDVLPVSLRDRDPAQLGSILILTLDQNIQFIAKQELLRALEKYGAESGTVIVMDPKTGGILANISYPSYDPNDYVDADPSHLADPAVSSMWEPGSIFKIVTWGAGLDTGTISPGTTFYDDGSMEVGGRTIQNWDRQGHGYMTMTDGLVKSLNTVAAFISTSMGKEAFYNYLRRFGFGNLTDVDLASEGPGMIKLPGDSYWFPSELGTNSFGQGIAVTPIQMIAAVSAVANRGLLMKPHVVHQYIKVEGDGQTRALQVEPAIVRRAISEETAATLTRMLVEVIEHGATEAQVPGYLIAGKTGTAQIPTAYGYHPDDTIASFVGYAPAYDPQFIVLVKLDKPQTSPWGSQTAAPTFKAIAERLFVYMHIPPDEIRLAQR